MRTPIYDFVRAYAERDFSRFHMPGHKGIGPLGCEAYDITEIEGADVLSGANGIIAESEANATALFDTAHSFYSTEGSSLSIKAMLALVTSDRKNGKPLILAARNVHRAFVFACALLDLEVAWIYPKKIEHLCSCTVCAEDVAEALHTLPRQPSAVYLTSPDYLGQTADIASIAEVCHAANIPLLVDNAHGAYLQFLSPSCHPIAQGADLCCDSAHKTLPVLTGGAYLHVSRNADPIYCKNARSAMALFASTSPSYLILQSLDLCNRYLSSGYREALTACIERTTVCKERLRALGFFVEDSEPLKIVVSPKSFGYLGTQLAEHLRKNGIEVEFADEDCLVLMVAPETRECDFARLEQAVASIPARNPISQSVPTIGKPEIVLSIRDAIFAPHQTIQAEKALGRICAAPTVSCPPAVPIVVSGERIDEQAIRVLLYYGIDTVEVVEE